MVAVAAADVDVTQGERDLARAQVNARGAENYDKAGMS